MTKKGKQSVLKGGVVFREGSRGSGGKKKEAKKERRSLYLRNFRMG